MSGVFHQSVLLSADTQLSDLPSSCNPCKTSTKPPSIYSWSHPIFPFIPPTPLHRMMFCCQATESLSSLVTLSPPASLPSVFALCSLTVLTVVLFFFSLPSPTEVSALQTCTFKKKKKKKKVLALLCVSLHTLWYVQMAWNGPKEPNKKRMKRKFLGEKDWTWKAAKCTS